MLFETVIHWDSRRPVFPPAPPAGGARVGQPPLRDPGDSEPPLRLPPYETRFWAQPPLRDGPRSGNFGDLVVGNDVILNKNCFYDVQNPKNFRLRRARVLFLFENR